MTYDTYYAKRGSKGALVKVVQRRLNEVMGTTMLVDGDYGPVTQAVMRDFQVANGLATTTYLDPPTALALGINVDAGEDKSASTSQLLPFLGLAIAAAWVANKYIFD